MTLMLLAVQNACLSLWFLVKKKKKRQIFFPPSNHNISFSLVSELVMWSHMSCQRDFGYIPHSHIWKVFQHLVVLIAGLFYSSVWVLNNSMANWDTAFVCLSTATFFCISFSPDWSKKITSDLESPELLQGCVPIQGLNASKCTVEGQNIAIYWQHGN